MPRVDRAGRKLAVNVAVWLWAPTVTIVLSERYGQGPGSNEHVSQQNTFTGRLTEPMLDAVFARAAALTR